MTDNSTLRDLQKDFDSYDIQDAMIIASAITGNENVKDYRNIMNRNEVVTSLASAKILSNMVHELTKIVAYTPALIRPTPLGEMLRNSLAETLESLQIMRHAFIETHKNDEGFSDQKIIDVVKSS